MSYGLQVNGEDGFGEFIQVDTDLGLRGFVITHAGSGSQISGIGYTDYDALVFVKGPIGTGEIICVEQNSDTTFFVTPESNYQGVFGEPVVVDYFVAQKVDDVSPIGDYGLQVFTQNGTVALDSRRITQNISFNVISVVPPNTIDGSNSVIHVDETKYVELSRWSFFNEGGVGEQSFAGAEWTSTSIRHWDLESEEYEDEGYGGQSSGGVLYWDNYAAILVADVYS